MPSRVLSSALRFELSRSRNFANCSNINEPSGHVKKQKFRGGNLLKFSQSLSYPAVCFTTTHPPLFLLLLPNPRSISPPWCLAHTLQLQKRPYCAYIWKNPRLSYRNTGHTSRNKKRRATRLPSSSVRSAFVGKIAVEKQTKLQATILSKARETAASPVPLTRMYLQETNKAVIKKPIKPETTPLVAPKYPI